MATWILSFHLALWTIIISDAHKAFFFCFIEQKLFVWSLDQLHDVQIQSYNCGYEDVDKII